MGYSPWDHRESAEQLSAAGPNTGGWEAPYFIGQRGGGAEEVKTSSCKHLEWPTSGRECVNLFKQRGSVP